MPIYVDPVCGQEIAADTPHRVRLGGLVYRFCSGQCQDRFSADPRSFTHAIDHICGQSVCRDDAEDLGLYSDHNAHRYYFCSQKCRGKFENAPDRFPSPPEPGAKRTGHDEPPPF